MQNNLLLHIIGALVVAFSHLVPLDANSQTFPSDLPPVSCVGVNSFLSQINIASVVNKRQNQPLDVVVEYFDQSGVLVGAVAAEIASQQKQDFIVNDMGLEANRIGTLCVRADTTAYGEWTGALVRYKPDFRVGPVGFGEAFDFALYFPFEAPVTGTSTVPINTGHIGTPIENTVANWVSISDAVPGDGKGVSGELSFYAADGSLLRLESVALGDGQTEDFSGHDAVSILGSPDAVGTATFVPDPGVEYRAHATRYFYDCPGSSCANFLTAFTISRREVVDSPVTAPVSTVFGELTAIEVVNVGDTLAELEVEVFNEAGVSAGVTTLQVAPSATTFLVISKGGSSGFLPIDSIGSARVTKIRGEFAVASLRYLLGAGGALQYGYASDFSTALSSKQLIDFNSFISHVNELLLINTSDDYRVANVRFVDFSGQVVWNRESLILAPKESRRMMVSLPKDLYGSVIVETSADDVISKMYLMREGRYVLPINAEAVVSGPPQTPLGNITAAELRVMPLGDSITQNRAGRTSYRYYLYKAMIANGLNANFVGTQQSNFGGPPKFLDFDLDHQGFWDWRADQLLANIYGWALATRPDYVLIHLGTNDMFQGQSRSSTINELRQIIGNLRLVNSRVRILLAQLIPSSRSNAEISLLNGDIALLANELNTYASPVLLINQNAGFNVGSDTYDGVHPNDSGDQKMTNKWFAGLWQLLGN